MKPNHQQRGVVLISVLLIVAIVALVSREILVRQTVSFKYTSMHIQNAQMLALQTGLVKWVKQRLASEDFNRDYHHLNQPWAQPILSTEFAGAEISGQLTDAQGKLNLNNLGLIQKDADQQRWKQIWQHFSRSYELPVNTAALLTDWVDPDQTVSEQGAESNQYRLKSPPMRTADRPMVLAQEISLLEGIDWLDFQQIQEWVIALPKQTSVNVNTASKAVLSQLLEGIDPAAADQWIEWRQSSPAKETNAFREFVASSTGRSLDWVETMLSDQVISVNSDFFLLQARIQQSELDLYVYALFDVGSGQSAKEVKVLQVWQGPVLNHF
ncbi:MAG: type II secretion system minor pseudopilin GspK [Hydrogenovibrio sp.]|uniref:type II secretion system minor pseudopilin GspK n=1 Tax=Hydrogenovibrio sp. TaxID=2065821 RepID=UPI0028708AE6|nr:type II secretion system minor pseudopilin GspK [Hydrogenovibrio sp.]MDR9499545.1 type II secretion system minor pseudopilin GspK [Hydrogenovibrio sp.]